jgi:hypothetical protein
VAGADENFHRSAATAHPNFGFRDTALITKSGLHDEIIDGTEVVV